MQPFSATAAALAATLMITSAFTHQGRRLPATPAAELPDQIAGWKSVHDLPLGARTLDRLKPTVYFSRRYAKAGQFLDVFVAYYAEQRAGESMHSPKQCLPGAGWEISRRGTTTIRIDGNSPEINSYSIQNARETMMVLYWYQSRNRIIASEYAGKILLMADAIRGRSTDGALVRITLEESPDALAKGRAFASALVPLIAQLFGDGDAALRDAQRR